MSDNLYFEPPSRLQLVDKLAHLLRFSNTLLVLAGPSGAGVTTVADQLHSQAVEDSVYILSLNLTASTNLNNLLKLLNDAMDELVNPQDSADQDGLSLLHKKIDTLAKLQRKLLVSIDNADFLSDEASESLVNLLSANQGKVAVTLAGSENLVVRARELVEAQGLIDSLHVEILSPFNRLETEEFIQLRFLRGNDFSKKQLSEIYLNSQGYPGRITLMTSQMIKSGKIKLNGKNNILPVPHIIGIAVLLTAITGGLLWQSSSDETLSDESLDTAGISTQPLPLNIAQEAELPSDKQAQQLEIEIAELSEKIKAQEQLIEKAKEDTAEASLLDLQESDDTAAIIEEGSELAEQQTQSTRGTDIELIDQIETPIEVLANAEGDQQKADVSTTQAPLAVEEPPIDNAEKNQASKEQGKNLSPNNVAIIEPAKNANEVIEALKQIEPVTDNTKPVLSIEKQLAQISEDLKKNIDPALLQPQSTSESLANAVIIQDITVSKQPKQQPVKPVAEVIVVDAVKPEPAKKPLKPSSKKPVANKPIEQVTDASAQKWLSHNAISNWPSSGYTLQLLGARSQSSAIRFLQSMPNSEKMHYYQTELKNKAWNVIIYGQYPNRAAATAAIAKLPKALRELKPWPKAIKSVKNSIKK